MYIKGEMHDNATVDQIADAMVCNIRQNKEVNYTISKTDNWVVKALYTPGEQNIKFYAEYLYKNGKQDATFVSVTTDGNVTQSNPAVQIRKDLIEKMISVVQQTSKKLSATTETKTDFELTDIIAAVARNLTAAPDNIGSMTLDQFKQVGTDFIDMEIKNGALIKETKNQDSSRLVIEGIIVDYDMSLLESILEKLEKENIMIYTSVQSKIKEALSKPNITPNEVYAVLAKNLKYVVNDDREKRGLQDGANDRSRMGGVLGYKIYNKSNKPFSYETLNFVTGQPSGYREVAPADYFYVSRMELAKIGSGITINCKIANGTIVRPLNKTNIDKLAWLRGFYVRYSNEASDNFKKTTDITQIRPSEWYRFLNFDTDDKKRQLERLLNLALSEDRIMQNANQQAYAQNIAGADKNTVFNMNTVMVSLDQAGVGYQKATAQTVSNVNVQKKANKKGGLFSMFKR